MIGASNLHGFIGRISTDLLVITRFFFGTGQAAIRIHGRPATGTFKLLSSPGQNQTKGHPENGDAKYGEGDDKRIHKLTLAIPFWPRNTESGRKREKREPIEVRSILWPLAPVWDLGKAPIRQTKPQVRCAAANAENRLGPL